MLSSSWIELEASAVAKNIRYLKKRIGSALFVSVIKGNAYGHGIEQFVPLAEKAGVSNFAVYDAQEASRALKAKAPQSQLLIMGMLDDDQLDWIVGNDIEFYVFTLERLTAAIEMAKKLKRKAIIHLELETGMNRTGIEEAEFPGIIEFIKKNRRHLCLKGICTHYAGAESVSNYFRIQNQYQAFQQLRKETQKKRDCARLLSQRLFCGSLDLPTHDHGYGTFWHCPVWLLAQYGNKNEQPTFARSEIHPRSPENCSQLENQSDERQNSCQG